MHDDLCQDLASVSFACESFRQDAEADCRRGRAALGRLADMILQALAKARRIADELDPVSPRPDGLTIALGELAARSAVNAGAVVQFTTRRAVDVRDRHVALHLFRVAERAVQDALMVNGAKRVTITLARTASGLQLTVAASSLPHAAHAAAAAPKGAWRASIEKTKSLGGRLTIAKSARTGATTVACVLPLETLARQSPS